MTTTCLDEQVSRNRDRFREDFAYQLTQKEFTTLMSQIVISNGRSEKRELRNPKSERNLSTKIQMKKTGTAQGMWKRFRMHWRDYSPV